jgi:hypothetical protein
LERRDEERGLVDDQRGRRGELEQGFQATVETRDALFPVRQMERPRADPVGGQLVEERLFGRARLRQSSQCPHHQHDPAVTEADQLARCLGHGRRLVRPHSGDRQPPPSPEQGESRHRLRREPLQNFPRSRQDHPGIRLRRVHKAPDPLDVRLELHLRPAGEESRMSRFHQQMLEFDQISRRLRQRLVIQDGDPHPLRQHLAGRDDRSPPPCSLRRQQPLRLEHSQGRLDRIAVHPQLGLQPQHPGHLAPQAPGQQLRPQMRGNLIDGGKDLQRLHPKNLPQNRIDAHPKDLDRRQADSLTDRA